MAQFHSHALLDTGTVRLRDVHCAGGCRQRGGEEAAESPRMVFAYRGVFERHVGGEAVVAQAQDLLFFNADEAYRVSHPLPGGDACLVLALSDEQLRESGLRDGRDSGAVRFPGTRRPLAAASRIALYRLLQRLRAGRIDPAAAEERVLSMLPSLLGVPPPAMRVLGPMRQLVDHVKLLLLADPARRWTLAEIGRAVQRSPVYLTQAFRRVEGMPLYRYQMQQRLNQALLRLPDTDDLTALALDLGFASHSHFTAAFRRAFGRTPAAHRREIRDG